MLERVAIVSPRLMFINAKELVYEIFFIQCGFHATSLSRDMVRCLLPTDQFPELVRFLNCTIFLRSNEKCIDISTFDSVTYGESSFDHIFQFVRQGRDLQSR